MPPGAITVPANRHDSPLPGETLDAAAGVLRQLPGVHPDRAHDSDLTRGLLERRGLIGAISEKGKPVPLKAGMRWVVERTSSWHDAHKKLAWCTEREGRVIGLLVGFLKRGHRCETAHTKSLDSLPLGEPTSPRTMTYWRKLLERRPARPRCRKPRNL